MALKPCLGRLPSGGACPRLTTGTRCVACERARDRRRQRAGKGVSYKSSAYREYRAKIQATGPTCHLCGEPGADSVDHDPPLARGGADGPWRWRPAHLACNLRRGAGHDEGGNPDARRARG
jgi:5-methylcytosine-specific restriction endonuclease McrA